MVEGGDCSEVSTDEDCIGMTCNVSVRVDVRRQEVWEEDDFGFENKEWYENSDSLEVTCRDM